MNKIEILQLSVRSMNGLKSDRIYYIEDLIVLSEQHLLKLPCLGVKSLNEIKNALNQIGLGLGMNPDDIELNDPHDSKKTIIETSFDLMPLIGISENIIEEYREKYQDSSVNLFRIIDFWITKRFTQKELKILKSRNNYWNKDQLTLQELGTKLGVTRERIRQIETKTNRKLWIIIEALFPYCHLIDLSQCYEFDRYFINDVSVINDRDNTNFSDYFLYKTLSILLRNDYQTIIDTTKKCQYLVRKAIGETFDFMGFIDKINSLLASNANDYQLTIKGLQYEYYKSPKFDDDVIDKVCEDLLYSEFNIIPDVDNNITIKSKKPKPIESYVEEALISNNKPTHLNDIYKTIKNKHPEFKKSIRYAGNAMIGNDKFIFFDRSSTYGLKIWEGKLTKNSILVDIVRPNKTKKNMSGIKVWHENGKVIVRGGTMIDIVIDYLKEFKEPQHIDNIFIEVDKWRETNKFRLMSNLKVNNRDYFVFENGHVGLLNE